MGAENPKPKGDFIVKGIDDETRIQNELKLLKPDLIGLTCCFSGYFHDALEVAAIAKRCYPTVPIVFGGAHASLEAKAVLKDNPQVDYVVVKEGEITLEELVKGLRGEREIESIEGFRGYKINI